jgi:hydroxyacylglutathione hydrolase
MIVERIWTGNAYRNYNYLIACPESGEALAIDPLDHEKCLNAARVKGWQITQILNTHEHHDHTGGNAAVVAATGAKVIAHHRAGGRIAGWTAASRRRRDQGRQDGRARVHGHAGAHHVPHLPALAHRAARLFSGDTLFNAGAGNCHNGGNPEDLYTTFVEQLAKLPENTASTRARLHREQPALHAGARARQRRRQGAAAGGGGHDPATGG